MKTLWVCTSTEVIEQLRKGNTHFSCKEKVFNFLTQFHYDWIAFTTKRKKCETEEKDYTYFAILGLEPGTDGDNWVKIRKGLCSECKHWDDSKPDSFGECKHPGKTLCGCTMFFIPKDKE